MIEEFQQRLHRPTNAGMVVNPTGFRIHFAFNDNLQLKAMPMHAATFVPGGHIGQGLGRFKKKVFGEAGFHGASLPFQNEKRKAKSEKI